MPWTECVARVDGDELAFNIVVITSLPVLIGVIFGFTVMLVV
jgi:hypothetical protein